MKLTQQACKICSKTCSTKRALAIHMLVHTGEKPYKCKHCDKSYSQCYDLTTHLRKKHFGDLIYKCETCPEAFRYYKDFYRHSKEHSAN